MNRLYFITLALLAFALAQPAEAHKRKLVSDTENTEGALIRYFISLPAPEDKVALMESFVAKYPRHESTTWVLAELQAIYTKAGQFEKAIVAGETILASDPDDLSIAQENLKAAEASKDPARIQRAAIAASQIARRLLRTPNEQEASPDFAKQVEAYCDYTLFTLATQAVPPAKRVAMMEEFAAQRPDSSYALQIRPLLFVAYQQAGNSARALRMAEEELKSGTNNVDMLLYAATKAYEKQDKAKVILYAKRLIETLPTQAVQNKPLKMGIARWMLGVIASNEQRWPDADIHLRAALPLVGQNKEIHAETLYHLGLANFKLGEARNDTKRIADAVRFNQLCAGIPGNFQEQAKQNVASIRSQFHLQ